jgi:hypothetical protein
VAIQPLDRLGALELVETARWMSDVASLGSRVAALLAMTGKKNTVEGVHLRV